jgi:hypothetical protein
MDGVLKVAGVMLTMLGVPMLMIYLVAPVLQSLGRRWAGTPDGGESELEALKAEVEALRELHPRIAELEERLDFAERLLARRDEMAPLPPTRD